MLLIYFDQFQSFSFFVIINITFYNFRISKIKREKIIIKKMQIDCF